MESSRIESYIRSTCSVLDFDLGELWCVKKTKGNEMNLKFVQQYSAPAFADFCSLLVESIIPLKTTESSNQISPLICKRVCDGGKIVWANIRDIDGLCGHTDIPLNTAIGVPVCSIGNDLYILVLFAVALVPMSPRLAEYLVSTMHAVTADGGSFLPVSSSLDVVASPIRQSYEGSQMKLSDLISKYSENSASHFSKLNVFDSKDILLICNLFEEFKINQKCAVTEKQLDSLRHAFKASIRPHLIKGEASETDSIIDRSAPIMALSAVAGAIGSIDTAGGDLVAGSFCRADDVVPTPAELESLHSMSRALSSTSASLNSSSMQVSPSIGSTGAQISPRGLITLLRHISSYSTKPNHSMLHIYAHANYRLSKCRFHEFMIAMLGVTIFDSAELWLPTESGAELRLAAAIYRTSIMRQWTALGVDLLLPVGVDVPGKVVGSGKFCWEGQYDTSSGVKSESSTSSGSDGPRLPSASDLGIRCALGVPVPGLRGPSGALVFFSPKAAQRVDPLLVELVESALRIITDPVEDRCEDANITAKVDSDALGFDARIQLCRSIVIRKRSVGNTETVVRSALESLVELGSAAVKFNHSSNDAKDKQKSVKHNPCTLTEMYCASSSSSSSVDGDLTEEQVLGMRPSATSAPPPPAPGSVPEDAYSDAVVSAARALANFGNFQWGTFLEGSGIEQNTEGYQSIKLGSDKVLDMYANWHDGSRKRKFDRNAPRSSVQGGEGGGEGLAVCLVDGCDYFVENPESQYCATHRGTRRCQKEGCGKCAQGATKFCIAHGGGRRCTYPGCFKGARDKLFCAAHGGGKRCTFEGCSKSAVGGSLLCTAHGGGKRCKFDGCNKSSQSSTDYCVKHGGGRSCMFKGCNKVARGKTDYCAAHGGGVRCKAKGCYKIAVGATSLCRMHSTAQAAATAGSIPPEHANLGSEALKLAVQNAGGGEDDDIDEGDEDSMDEKDVLFSAAGKGVK